MSVTSLWPVNIWQANVADRFTPTEIQELLEIGDRLEKAHPTAHVPVMMRKGPEQSYNLLQYDSPAVFKFRDILKSALTDMAAAEGYVETPQFEAITTLRRFASGEGARPHAHRSVDYVAAFWLDLDITDDGSNVHQKTAGNRMLLIDPMSNRSRFLNHKMLHHLRVAPGLLLIHPAHLFHTTEMNLGVKDTSILVTNIRLVDSVREYFPL